MENSKPRILIAEDHLLAQKLAVMAIDSLDYQIDTADTGAETIAKFKQHRYDFIFMDLGLPDIDGCTVVETIRGLEKETYTHTPIVALTAHTDNKIRQNALKSGMDAFISKPLTTDKAKAMLDKFISQKCSPNVEATTLARSPSNVAREKQM